MRVKIHPFIQTKGKELKDREAVKKEDGSKATVKYIDGQIRLGGIGSYLGDEIYKMTNAETRVTVLGHVQRGGNPVGFDRVLATEMGEYAVELLNFGEEGPGPGRVVMLTAEGPVAVVEGLLAPFAIAKGPDGALYVSYGTIAFAPGMTGGVVKIAMDM